MNDIVDWIVRYDLIEFLTVGGMFGAALMVVVSFYRRTKSRKFLLATGGFTVLSAVAALPGCLIVNWWVLDQVKLMELLDTYGAVALVFVLIPAVSFAATACVLAMLFAGIISVKRGLKMPKQHG